MRVNTIRLTTIILGFYVSILGIVHGIFEILQGNEKPSSILIGAIGSPCVAENTWHACLPAMTFVPNFLIAGILTIIFAISIIASVIIFGKKNFSGIILLILSLLLLFSGGGFIAPFYSFVTAILLTRVAAPLNWWQNKFNESFLRILATSWVWLFSLLIFWNILQWMLGFFLNDFMTDAAGSFLIVELILLILTAIATIVNRANQLKLESIITSEDINKEL